MQPSLPPCDPAFTIRRAKTRRRFVETADPHFNVGWVEVEQARAAGWAKASSAERADGSGHFGISGGRQSWRFLRARDGDAGDGQVWGEGWPVLPLTSGALPS